MLHKKATPEGYSSRVAFSIDLEFREVDFSPPYLIISVNLAGTHCSLVPIL